MSPSVAVTQTDNYTLKVPDESVADNGTSLSSYTYSEHISIHAAKSTVTPGKNTSGEAANGSAATNAGSSTVGGDIGASSDASLSADTSATSSTVKTGDILGFVTGVCVMIAVAAIGILTWMNCRKGKER